MSALAFAQPGYDLFAAPVEVKPLRPHQSEAITQLRRAIIAGNSRIVLQLPTGAGKTRTAAEIINGALAKGKRVAFTVPAISLVDQTVREFEEQGIRAIGVMQARHVRTDSRQPVQVVSVQTLARRERPEADLVIVDECFVPGTLVLTPKGELPIESIRPGDLVVSAQGVSTVEATSCKLSANIVTVEFDDGTRLTCTAQHPFFTQDGWRSAGALEVGSLVIGEQDLRGMFDSYGSTTGVGLEEAIGDRGGRGALECASNLLQILRQEADEPFAFIGRAAAYFGNTQGYRPRANDARRQWDANDKAAGGFVEGIGAGMDVRVHGECLEGTSATGGAGALQDRLGLRITEDRTGDRRRQPFAAEKAGAGSPERCIFEGRRVVRVSRDKCEGARTVHNLQVSGHPSYFAAGVLVHNCHIQHQSVIDWMADDARRTFIGLSATPWARGMGESWQSLILPVTMQELIDAEFLSPFRVYAPSSPDLSGVKTVAGDYHEGQLAEVMGGTQLVADVVQTWKARAQGLPTLVFAVNKAHAKQLRQQFSDAGVEMGYCDDRVDLIERRFLFDQMKQGRLAGIVNIGTLTTGVDADIRCIVLARPTKSEMLFVQMIGRGLRTAEGKSECLILDHADNHFRMGFVTDIAHDTLLTGKDKTAPTKSEKGEATPKPCPSCGTLKKGGPCPSCGFVPERNSEIEVEAGELVEFKPKAPKHNKAEKQLFWSMALHVDRQRSKAGKLAKALYRSKFGVWPQGLSAISTAPDAAFLAYETSRRIAYAKSKHRRPA